MWRLFWHVSQIHIFKKCFLLLAHNELIFTIFWKVYKFKKEYLLHPQLQLKYSNINPNPKWLSVWISWRVRRQRSRSVPLPPLPRRSEGPIFWQQHCPASVPVGRGWHSAGSQRKHRVTGCRHIINTVGSILENEDSEPSKRMKEKKPKNCTRCRLLLGLPLIFWNKRSLSCTGKTRQPLSYCFTPSSFRSIGGMKNGSSGQNNHAGIDQCLLFLLFVCCCQKKQNCDQNRTPVGRKTGERSALWKYFFKYFSVVFLFEDISELIESRFILLFLTLTHFGRAA